MNPEERKMLESMLRISEQNNRILRSMHRQVVIGRIVRIFYWVAILVIAYVAYIYLQPYISELEGVIQKNSIVMPR